LDWIGLLIKRNTNLNVNRQVDHKEESSQAGVDDVEEFDLEEGH
jgi:hypothetical protein